MYQFTIISIYPNISIYQFSIYKPINQSVNQSISQSINLSIQQSSNQSKKVILFFSSSSSSVFLRPLSPFPPLPPPPSHAPPPPLHRHHGRHHDHHHHHGHHDLNDFYDHHLIVTIPITITITCTVMNVSHLSPSSLNAVAFLFNIIVFSCNLQVNVKILVKKYPPSPAGFRPLHVASSAAVACDRFVLVSGYPGTKELDQTALFYAARQGHANTIRRGQSKQIFKTFNYPGKRS